MHENKANPSIECTVQQCRHHCGEVDHCSLNAIKVGTHESNPTEAPCTDCQSFDMKSYF